MQARHNPQLTREEVRRIAAAAVDGFRDGVDLDIAAIRPGQPVANHDEPRNAADRARGMGALVANRLRHNDVTPFSLLSQFWARSVAGKKLEPDGPDERRVGRAILQGIASEIPTVIADFEALAEGEGRSSVRLPRILGEAEYEIDPEDLAALRAAKKGDKVGHILARLRPVQDTAAPDPEQDTPEPAPASPDLRNARKTISELWDEFGAAKVVMKEWRPNEVTASRTTLKLWVALQGDRPPSAFTAGDVSRFHQQLKKIPSKYYHNKELRDIYEKHGIAALIKATEGRDVPRLSDKTWNSYNSTLNAFFKWCAGKGEALPKGTPSICAEEFIWIKRGKAKFADSEVRRIYEDSEIQSIFSASKFMGARSGRDWKTQGPLVVRDHRYWLTFINALHGSRREEPTLLKVKHVTSVGGIWFFNWKAPEIVPLLKNMIGSPRDVPLHDILLRLGFLEARVFGRDPEASLFPEAYSHSVMKRNAEPYGKWFGLFSDHCGVTDPLLDTHAWRHTVTTHLGWAGVGNSLIEQLVGHDGEGQTSEKRTYTHEARLERLQKSLNKWQPPIDVDALTAAVARSDAVDRSAAWPDLSDPDLVPKPKRSRRK